MSAHFLFASEVAERTDDSIDKLLIHQIGMSHLRKHPVTVRSALEACGRDPDQTARSLMIFVSDYGHCATALLGIAALGILLAFPTLML